MHRQRHFGTIILHHLESHNFTLYAPSKVRDREEIQQWTVEYIQHLPEIAQKSQSELP